MYELCKRVIALLVILAVPFPGLAQTNNNKPKSQVIKPQANDQLFINNSSPLFVVVRPQQVTLAPGLMVDVFVRSSVGGVRLFEQQNGSSAFIAQMGGVRGTDTAESFGMRVPINGPAGTV